MGVRGDQVDAPELFALRDCDDGLSRIHRVSSSASRHRNDGGRGGGVARTAAMVVA